MRYAPPGLCLNDFEILHGPDGYHAVHLQGPWNDRFDEKYMETSYGHARSDDLVEWETLGPCFGVGRPGRFDSSAVWTMHTVPCAGGTAMTYTGVSAQPWAEQAVGLAFTDRTDATGWMRVRSEPIVRADPRWYRTGEDMAWRDPFVVRDGGRWVMVVCASSLDLRPERAGAIGYAVSDDLLRWEVAPPVLVPGTMPELECPVLERSGDGWLLLGSISSRHQIEAWSSTSTAGPWLSLGPVAPPGPYAPRLVDGPDGERLVLHTSQRRTGLHNSGAPCRGTLAQPKLFDTTNPLRPRMRWWPGVERHIEPVPTEAAAQGLVDIAVRDDMRIALRGAPGSPELVLACDENEIGLHETSGGGDVRRTHTVLDTPAARLKILQVGEYIEVYADGVLVLSELDYRTPARPVLLGCRPEALPVRALRSIGPERDDISAVAADALAPAWVLSGDASSSRGSPLVGRISLRG